MAIAREIDWGTQTLGRNLGMATPSGEGGTSLEAQFKSIADRNKLNLNPDPFGTNVGDDEYTDTVDESELTDTSSTTTEDDETDIGYGGSGVDKVSAATLKRKGKGGRGMRSKMRKDLKIKEATGRNQIHYPT